MESPSSRAAESKLSDASNSNVSNAGSNHSHSHGNNEEDEKWSVRFGARVLLPIQVDMDVLELIIGLSTTAVSTHHWTGDSSPASVTVVRDVKLTLDQTLGGTWHVIAGRDFGSLVTHHYQQFAFYQLKGINFLVFRCGPNTPASTSGAADA